MLWRVVPGGVVAGVVGIDRAALLRPVSIDIELAPWLPLIPCWPHWKLSEVPMPPMTLDALVGGVGKVWARSMEGRPMLAWEVRGGWPAGTPIE
jgi:hypothetical protein